MTKLSCYPTRMQRNWEPGQSEGLFYNWGFNEVTPKMFLAALTGVCGLEGGSDSPFLLRREGYNDH